MVEAETVAAGLRPVWHTEPMLYRKPCWGAWASGELVLRGLEALRDQAPTGVGWRGFSGETLVSRDSQAALPHASEAGLDEYLRRLGREHDDPGIIVNQFQATSMQCWAAVAPLVDEIFTSFGFTHGGALLDLFLSGKQESFFGLHKDDQDVLMFVAEGCKRVELWRYETLSSTLGSPGFYTPKHLGQVEVDVAPDVVFEGQAGDVVYWPAGYWHRV